MDVTFTRADLVTRALRKLNVIGAGQAADAEDADLVDSMVDSTLGMLASKGVIEVANEGAIPAAHFEPLADILAAVAAPDFGKASDTALVGAAVKARADLHEMLSSKPTYETLKASYF